MSRNNPIPMGTGDTQEVPMRWVGGNAPDLRKAEDCNRTHIALDQEITALKAKVKKSPVRAFFERHAAWIAMGSLTILLALTAFLGNLALQINTLQAQVEPLVTDHDVLIRVDTTVRNVDKKIDELGMRITNLH